MGRQTKLVASKPGKVHLDWALSHHKLTAVPSPDDVKQQYMYQLQAPRALMIILNLDGDLKTYRRLTREAMRGLLLGAYFFRGHSLHTERPYDGGYTDASGGSTSCPYPLAESCQRHAYSHLRVKWGMAP